MTDTYKPPKIWTWDQASGGKFANINRPISGRHMRQRCPEASILFSYIL